MSGDDSSSSDDDIPLSALGKKSKVERSDEEAEFNDDDDDDEEMGEKKASSPTKKAAPKKKSTTTKSKSSSSSSSSARKTAKSTTSSSKKSKASSSTTSSSTSTSGGSNYLCASNELYSHCDKGKLIQSLLSRWWHAYQWPDPKILMEPTPRGYDALDGFPGVYICTQGSNVGKFIDRRNHEQSPSFRNFARKSSEELKELLLTAIEKQMKELIQHEGEGTETEKNLKVLNKWANKLNCAKADKEAEKVLKAKRLVLP
ncbi:hypothetical protein ACHAXH_006382 [Discostella pseudostelligera]